MTLACLYAGLVRGAPEPRAHARVVDAFGTVQKLGGQPNAIWTNVSVGDLLTPGTTLKTGERSAALVQLPDRHILRVGGRSTVELRALGKERVFSFKVLSGRVWSVVQGTARPARYEVETPSAVVGVTGTLFCVDYDEATDETEVSTEEGEVIVRQGERQLRVGRGLYARLRRNHVGPVPVLRQPEELRRMWSMLRRHEAWMLRQGGQLRLNRQIEPHLRRRHAPRRPEPGRRPPRRPRAPRR